MRLTASFQKNLVERVVLLSVCAAAATACTDKTQPPPGPELAVSAEGSGSDLPADMGTDDSGPVVQPDDEDVTPEPAFADEKSVSTPVNSVDDWKKLSADTRQDLIDMAFTKQPAMVKTPLLVIADVKDPAQKVFAEKMLKFMQSNSDLKIDDPGHGLIGSLDIKVAVVTLKNGALLGGEIFFSQAGCDMADETTPRFKSKAAAEAGGCEPGTLAWTGHGTFNFDMSPFEYSDFLEAGY